jgi:IS30 family transposase
LFSKTAKLKETLMTYKQITETQRYQIYALRKMKHSQSAIARTIGVHRSTIGRELKRNSGQRNYRPKQAHQMALSRRDKAKPTIMQETWQLVESKLRLAWSPEQISGWFKVQGEARVSHERIYQHILQDKKAGGDLYQSLRCQKKRRKRYGSYDRRGQLPGRTSIEERPAIVSERTRLGDLEIDTVIGKGHQGALVTIVDRKSRFTFIKQIERKQAEEVYAATVALLQPVSDRILTITADNGKEFAQHQQIADALGVQVYFAHPYASWERGTNENTNGLIRQYFPKSTNFKQVTEVQVTLVADRLNNRPRKILGYQTPSEVFFGLSPVALTN